MTSKEYLSQVYWLNRIINNKLEQKEELEALAERTTVNISQEKISGGNRSRSPMEDTTVKLIDLSNEINDDVDELIKLKEEVDDTIQKLGDYRHRTILEMRYLNNKAWPYITRTLGYDRSTVFRQHKKALEKVDELIKNAT